MEAGKVDGVEDNHGDSQQKADKLAVTRKVLTSMKEMADPLRRKVQGDWECHKEEEKENEE